MRYSLNPEFDQRLKEAFDELGIEEAAAEAFLELMDRAVIAFSDKVCLPLVILLKRVFPQKKEPVNDFV